MLIVSAGRTAPNRAVRFGVEDSALDDRGRRDAERLRGELTGRAICGPERSVRQTAQCAGLDTAVMPDLASLDVGSWRGRAPEDIDPAELRAWFGDVDWRGHGGESVAEFVERIRGVVIDADVLIVAKPVAQALLCDGVDTFFAREVRPATVYAASDRPGMS